MLQLDKSTDNERINNYVEESSEAYSSPMREKAGRHCLSGVCIAGLNLLQKGDVGELINQIRVGSFHCIDNWVRVPKLFVLLPPKLLTKTKPHFRLVSSSYFNVLDLN